MLKRGAEERMLQEETRWRWTASFYDLVGAYARMDCAQQRQTQVADSDAEALLGG